MVPARRRSETLGRDLNWTRNASSSREEGELGQDAAAHGSQMQREGLHRMSVEDLQAMRRRLEDIEQQLDALEELESLESMQGASSSSQVCIPDRMESEQLGRMPDRMIPEELDLMESRVAQ